MKAIIIAAGMGSRLGKLTNDIPKPLIEINGKSILERQISSFNRCGISEIVVITGYKSERFTIKNIKYIFNPLFAEVEQAHSFLTAREELNDDVIISFGDIIFEDKILKQILEVESDIVLGVDYGWKKSYQNRTDNPPNMSDFVAIKNKKIVKLFRKSTEFDNNTIVAEFSGLFKITSESLEKLIKIYDRLESNHRGRFHFADSLKKAKIIDILQELLENNFDIQAVNLEGKWVEIDTPNDLEIAKTVFNE